MSQPSLALVINTYNAPKKLDAVLRWLNQGNQKPDELLIADDGSADETRDLVRDWQSRSTYPVHHIWQADDGYRRSRVLNLAIAQAKSDYLVFIDGDCLPFRRFVSDHRLMAERPSFVQGRRCFVPEAQVPGLIAGKSSLKSLFFSGKISGAFKAIRWPRPVIKRNQELTGILGCNLGIWRDDLIAVNGYDESFEGWGAEDSDLAARLYHLGRTRKFVYGRCQLAHLNHGELSRDRYDLNKQKLAQAIESKRIRAELGLDQHLDRESSK
ncbi:MAG: glycosyltransferase [Verrucomicrobiota bacterium]